VNVVEVVDDVVGGPLQEGQVLDAAVEREEAEAYVQEFRPLDCAGGYRIEDAGIRLFERIRSDDYTGIIGLPLIATAKLLRRVGLLP